MARLHVTDLQPADEVQAWMRLGFAIRKARKTDGTIYRYVPAKAQKAKPGDLTSFSGIVIQNDVTEKVLTLQVADNNSLMRPTSYGESLIVSISYSSFGRLRRISKFTFEPKEESKTRPTGKALGTAFKAYRTAEEVSLV